MLLSRDSELSLRENSRVPELKAARATNSSFTSLLNVQIQDGYVDKQFTVTQLQDGWL